MAGTRSVQLQCPRYRDMEVLTRPGSDEHKEQWLKPLPEGTIRLAFAMTEPRHPDTSPPTRSGGNRDRASLSR
jgi:alkylation response protein AidB-like acyl-CoA dehydrogenase